MSDLVRVPQGKPEILQSVEIRRETWKDLEQRGNQPGWRRGKNAPLVYGPWETLVTENTTRGVRKKDKEGRINTKGGL